MAIYSDALVTQSFLWITMASIKADFGCVGEQACQEKLGT